MEANIIYRIAKGDEMAFDAFMDHYSSALYHYAYGIVGSKESAEEVVSDVFFEVWKVRKTILEIESMEAWLEKAREFDPFGHTRFDPSGVIRLIP